MDKRIVFMGTPDFAAVVLKRLIAEKFNIVGVFSQPDKPKGRGKKLLPTPVKETALENNLPVYQPSTVNKGEGFEVLKELKPDFIITAAYGKLLKQKVLDIPECGCWNIHASLLPKYRGAAPIQRAIENGEEETGITIFRMVEELDAGPMALKKGFRIEENDNYGSIHDKLAIVGSDLIVEFLNTFDSIKPEEQPESDTNYAEKINEEDLKIDFDGNTKSIINKIKAYDPVPGVKVKYNNEPVKVFEASIHDGIGQDFAVEPGTVTGYDKKGIIIRTADGFVKIGKIQFPGKNVIPAFDAVNGRKITVNSKFEKI